MAEQGIEVVRDNTVPVQQVEEGFSVQDHIEAQPLKLRISIILFDSSEGHWISRGDAYDRLKTIYNNKSLVEVDCSEHTESVAPVGYTYTHDKHLERTTKSYTEMIYDNMAMTHLGQVVQHGNVFFCEVRFTQITKSEITTKQLFVQEIGEVTDDDGNVTQGATVLWSDEPFGEPTEVEVAETVPLGEYMRMSPSERGVPTVPEMLTDVIKSATDKVGAVYDGIISWATDSIEKSIIRGPF